MDEKLPLVSIVTPSYNKGTFIERTVLSVKNQTYPRVEHIVIDGGSTDGTLDILRKYSDSCLCISEPDKGQSDAINKGWRMARGDILGWLNADDTYMPWAVETAVKLLSENPDVAMVYGRCNIIDEHDKVTGEHFATEFDLADMLCYRVGVPQQAAFFRKRVLDEVYLRILTV
jgi:glycosyltransferase involved in cell wall biosynthesis